MDFTIIEDDYNFQKFVETVLGKYHGSIKVYSSDTAFLSSAKNIQDNDVFFIDIDLQCQQNGIELAEWIRAQNAQAYIVFITNSTEHCLSAVNRHIGPFDYLVKGLELSKLKKDVEETVRKIYNVENVKSDNLKVIKCQTALGLMVIPQKDILYLNKIKNTNNTYIKTLDSEFVTSTRFKNIKNQLPSDIFAKDFKSLVINLCRVKEIDTKDFSICFNNGQSLVLSERLIYKLRKRVLQAGR